MERTHGGRAIRGGGADGNAFPDYAALHPGYEHLSLITDY
jgi:hypothetical protein